MPPPFRRSTDHGVPIRPIKTSPRSILPPNPAPTQTATPPPVRHGAPPLRRPPIPLPVAPVAPGVNRGAALSASEMDHLRRRDLRTRQRTKAQLWIFAASTAAAMLAAFAGGFLWKSPGDKATAKEGPTVNPEQQRQALALMDDAVRAKREERYKDAINDVAKAREADPSIRGGDIVLAEIAYRRSDSPLVQRFTREALQRGENIADANLLLALDKWRSRALPGAPVTGADEFIAQMLAEASLAEMWNGIPRFFLGDLQGLMGRGSEGQRSLLGSLYRMQPWGSLVVLSAKREVAAAEAGLDVTETPAGSALVSLRSALSENADVSPPLNSLRATLSAYQRRILLSDASLPISNLSAAVARARNPASDAIPHGTITPPDTPR